MSADLNVYHDGSVCLVGPRSALGEAWLTENIDPEPWQMCGNAIALETRYVGRIIEGAQNDGLTVTMGRN